MLKNILLIIVALFSLYIGICLLMRKKSSCSECYSHPKLPFSGKTVLVTGGTSGIGLATAKAFCEQGASRVFVCGRTQKRWNNAKKTFQGKYSQIKYIPCDVRVEAQVKKMIESIGELHIAFNNAGVATGAPVEQQVINNQETKKDIQYSIPFKNCPIGTTDPNTHYCENPIFTDGMGLMYCLKYELPAIRKSGGGSIVNTASVNSMWGSPGGAIYSVAKGMVQMITKSAGVYEVSRKDAMPVRINCVAPGPVDTPLLTSQLPKGISVEVASKGVPMGRVAEPKEIASVVLFLADNEKASYITGSTVVVDGGLTAAPLIG